MGIGVGEAEVQDGREAVGRGQPERQARKREEAPVRLGIGSDRGKRRGELRPALREGRRAPLAAEREAQRTASERAPAKRQALQVLPLYVTDLDLASP